MEVGLLAQQNGAENWGAYTIGTIGTAAKIDLLKKRKAIKNILCVLSNFKHDLEQALERKGFKPNYGMHRWENI